jgi:hypothetical protein
MKKLLREPLLHFLLLGSAIFIAYGFVTKRAGEEPGKIVITQGQIENLAAGFTKAWHRPPTPEELTGLIQDRVREEVYSREAMALGMDKDDTIIRRRLRQKMEFISDDLAAPAEPTDADLDGYLKAHADQFRTDQRLSFCHVYLQPQKHGDRLASDAAQLLEKLKQEGDSADISALGDSFLLGTSFDAESAADVAKQFGGKFAAKLGEVLVGQWQGPIESGYGVHLVRVSERTEGRMPALADVRDAVRREWGNSRRLEANEKFYQELRRRYAVTIEEPKPAAEPAKVAKVP